MSNEKLCLKWTDFQNLMQVSFGELRTDNDFTDVTLACEDQSIKAHKVVLSACSPFFKKLLKTHPHPHPLIYMNGMKSNSLVAIIDFLYLGEANVSQEELDSFLALAEELQLKGLVGNSKNVKVTGQPTETFNHTERKPDVIEMRDVPESGASQNVFQNEVKSFEGRVVMTYQQKPSSRIEPATMAKIESMIERRIDGKYCRNCGYTSNHTSHMKEHVEKHIEGLEYPCTLCNKVLRSSLAFREHKRRCPPINFS